MKRAYPLAIFTLVVLLCLAHATAVQASTPSPVPVREVSISLESVELLSYGEPVTLRARVRPLNATNQRVFWFSSNPAVATVVANSDAVVTPHAPGTALITVRTEDGPLNDTCTVVVLSAVATPSTGGGSNNNYLPVIIVSLLLLAFSLQLLSDKKKGYV